MKKTTKIIFASISITLCSAALSMSAISLAGFGTNQAITQTVSSSGKLPSLLYLNPGTWNVDNPFYIIHAWKDGGAAYTDIKGTKIATNGYYVFEFAYPTYDRLVIYRCKTETDFSTFNPATDIWNQTETISYSGTNKLYTITGWATTDYTVTNY